LVNNIIKKVNKNLLFMIMVNIFAKNKKQIYNAK